MKLPRFSISSRRATRHVALSFIPSPPSSDRLGCIAAPPSRVARMGAAFGWGLIAASSLVLGMLLGLARSWPSRLIGLVLAFGAGALISAVSFELFEEGIKVGGATAVGLGLAAGAIVYFVLSRLVERIGPGGRSGGGTALALGAFLDGIPEQIVLGIGIAGGQGVSIGLLAAIFVSNLPEAVGSATDMRESGTSKRQIRLLWLAVAGFCALAP